MNRREIASVLSAIENREPETRRVLAKAFHKSSLKKTVCFTGPAGVGKSTVISGLACLAARKQKVAWIACDPSSPMTGGSLLGDRIRISGQSLTEKAKENLFIRSLSTRGSHATSRAIRDIEVYLEGIFDQVWVETAGSGQSQSEIASLSAITVLILQPETGDEVQWMKAGLRELADIFLVNKSDLGGADQVVEALHEQGVPMHSIGMLSAKNETGLKEALEIIERHQSSKDLQVGLSRLHRQLAEDLFIEIATQKAKAEFLKIANEYSLNPYR